MKPIPLGAGPSETPVRQAGCYTLVRWTIFSTDFQGVLRSLVYSSFGRKNIMVLSGTCAAGEVFFQIWKVRKSKPPWRGHCDGIDVPKACFQVISRVPAPKAKAKVGLEGWCCGGSNVRLWELQVSVIFHPHLFISQYTNPYPLVN